MNDDAPDQAREDVAGAIALAHRLLDAARGGDAALLVSYVDRGVPVDLSDADGNSLLMLAAYHGNAEAVRVLLERGADPDRLNDRGQSPLAGSVFKGEEETEAKEWAHDRGYSKRCAGRPLPWPMRSWPTELRNPIPGPSRVCRRLHEALDGP